MGICSCFQYSLVLWWMWFYHTNLRFHCTLRCSARNLYYLIRILTWLVELILVLTWLAVKDLRVAQALCWHSQSLVCQHHSTSCSPKFLGSNNMNIFIVASGQVCLCVFNDNHLFANCPISLITKLSYCHGNRMFKHGPWIQTVIEQHSLSYSSLVMRWLVIACFAIN